MKQFDLPFSQHKLTLCEAIDASEVTRAARRLKGASMFIATLISLFKAPKPYVWQPAVTMDDPAIVSALTPTCGG